MSIIFLSIFNQCWLVLLLLTAPSNAFSHFFYYVIQSLTTIKVNFPSEQNTAIQTTHSTYMSKLYGHLQQLSCIRLQKLDFSIFNLCFIAPFLWFVIFVLHCDQFFKVVPCEGFCTEELAVFMAWSNIKYKFTICILLKTHS